jgi:hypothetical protein
MNESHLHPTKALALERNGVAMMMVPLAEAEAGEAAEAVTEAAEAVTEAAEAVTEAAEERRQWHRR